MYKGKGLRWRKNNHRSGGTYLFAKEVGIIAMVRRVGRKHVLSNGGCHLRSAALLKQAILKLGVGAALSRVEVHRGQTAGLLPWLTGR
jgi:hypothetical protein